MASELVDVCFDRAPVALGDLNISDLKVLDFIETDAIGISTCGASCIKELEGTPADRPVIAGPCLVCITRSWRLLLHGVVACLGFGRHEADGFEKPAIVEPVHPIRE